LARPPSPHFSAQALASGLLPRYRTLDSNQPPIRIAEALGFVRYFTSVAARFESIRADDLPKAG
jgi:hypothetical protein